MKVKPNTAAASCKATFERAMQQLNGAAQRGNAQRHAPIYQRNIAVESSGPPSQEKAVKDAAAALALLWSGRSAA